MGKAPANEARAAAVGSGGCMTDRNDLDWATKKLGARIRAISRWRRVTLELLGLVGCGNLLLLDFAACSILSSGDLVVVIFVGGDFVCFIFGHRSPPILASVGNTD